MRVPRPRCRPLPRLATKTLKPVLAPWYAASWPLFVRPSCAVAAIACSVAGIAGSCKKVAFPRCISVLGPPCVQCENRGNSQTERDLGPQKGVRHRAVSGHLCVEGVIVYGTFGIYEGPSWNPFVQESPPALEFQNPVASRQVRRMNKLSLSVLLHLQVLGRHRELLCWVSTVMKIRRQ